MSEPFRTLISGVAVPRTLMGGLFSRQIATASLKNLFKIGFGAYVSNLFRK